MIIDESEFGFSRRIMTGPFILPVSKPDFRGCGNLSIDNFLSFIKIGSSWIIYILAGALSLKFADSSSVSDHVKKPNSSILIA